VSYLLDTNVCIALINGTSSKVRARFADVSRQRAALATSAIVVHELWYGVAKSELASQNARALAVFLNSGIAVLDYSVKDAQAAGEIRAELERRGKRIGEYETLIAGQAYCRNLTLVTANTGEFARVHRLKVEDWTL
jgi:tRNA(fMet)-specific endonuclease VapC